MSETLRETIREAAEDSFKYYQLLEAESDRGGWCSCRGAFRRTVKESYRIP